MDGFQWKIPICSVGDFPMEGPMKAECFVDGLFSHPSHGRIRPQWVEPNPGRTGKLGAINWLVVEKTPLKNMSSSIGMMTFPTEWENKKCQPNHQPASFERDTVVSRRDKWVERLKPIINHLRKQPFRVGLYHPTDRGIPNFINPNWGLFMIGFTSWNNP